MEFIQLDPPLVQTSAALIRQIDADTDALYASVQGNRGPEYQLAEIDAIAYRDAGYTGTVPSSVQSWATAKSQTATWATDSILATATSWRFAQAQIRANRLACKEAARTTENVPAVRAQWEGFLSAITSALLNS